MSSEFAKARAMFEKNAVSNTSTKPTPGKINPSNFGSPVITDQKRDEIKSDPAFERNRTASLPPRSVPPKTEDALKEVEEPSSNAFSNIRKNWESIHQGVQQPSIMKNSLNENRSTTDKSAPITPLVKDHQAKPVIRDSKQEAAPSEDTPSISVSNLRRNLEANFERVRTQSLPPNKIITTDRKDALVDTAFKSTLESSLSQQYTNKPIDSSQDLTTSFKAQEEDKSDQKDQKNLDQPPELPPTIEVDSLNATADVSELTITPSPASNIESSFNVASLKKSLLEQNFTLKQNTTSSVRKSMDNVHGNNQVTIDPMDYSHRLDMSKREDHLSVSQTCSNSSSPIVENEFFGGDNDDFCGYEGHGFGEADARSDDESFDEFDLSSPPPIPVVSKPSRPFLIPFQYDPTPRARESHYAEIDKHAKSTPKKEEETMEMLVRHLTSPYSFVEDKTRSLYCWIAENIDYDVEGYLSGTGMCFTAEQVWKTRRGVCSGYSDLFYKFCKLCGVTCDLIRGYAKGVGYSVGKKFTDINHEWVAVKTEDGNYHLIEPTWGAGYLNGRSFKKEFTDRYFFMSPAEFITDHFPLDDVMQLLDEPVSLNDFEDSLRIRANGYNQGLEAISHKKPFYLLNETNRVVLEMKAKPGSKWLVNMKEKSSQTVLWDCTSMDVSDDGSLMKCLLLLEKKNVEYEVLIFIGDSSENTDFGVIYTFKVGDSALMNLGGFPTKFPNFKEMRIKLNSPTEGKLKAGSLVKFSLEIPQPVTVILKGDSTDQQRFVKVSSNLYELEYQIPTVPQLIHIFAGQGALESILRYSVE